jgi:hypothetical protein
MEIMRRMGGTVDWRSGFSFWGRFLLDLKSRGVLTDTLELPMCGSPVAALGGDPHTEGEKPDCFSPSLHPLFFPEIGGPLIDEITRLRNGTG